MKGSKHPPRKQILIEVWPRMSADNADMDAVEHSLAQRYVIKDSNSLSLRPEKIASYVYSGSRFFYSEERLRDLMTRTKPKKSAGNHQHISCWLAQTRWSRRLLSGCPAACFSIHTRKISKEPAKIGQDL